MLRKETVDCTESFSWREWRFTGSWFCPQANVKIKRASHLSDTLGPTWSGFLLSLSMSAVNLAVRDVALSGWSLRLFLRLSATFLLAKSLFLTTYRKMLEATFIPKGHSLVTDTTAEGKLSFKPEKHLQTPSWMNPNWKKQKLCSVYTSSYITNCRVKVI